MRVRPSGSQSTCALRLTIATHALARFQPSGVGSQGCPLAVISCSHGPGSVMLAFRRSMSPNFCIASRASVAASRASFHAWQSGPPSGRSRYCFGISLNMPTSTDRACSSRPVTRSASCLGRPAIVRLLGSALVVALIVSRQHETSLRIACLLVAVRSHPTRLGMRAERLERTQARLSPHVTAWHNGFARCENASAAESGSFAVARSGIPRSQEFRKPPAIPTHPHTLNNHPGAS